MAALKLGGIDPKMQPLHEAAANAVKDALFSDIGYPALKSEEILIMNDPRRATPLYCAGVRYELIFLTSAGNYPWQYSYQLAHEFGHMSARSDLRHPRVDGLMWIEEMLADCHSLIALHRMGQTKGALEDGANKYLQSLLATHCDETIDKDWFRAQQESLRESRKLTDPCKSLSRFIYANVEHEQILRDNRLLIELDTGLELGAYLDLWSEFGDKGRSVPSSIKALF